MIRLRNRVEGGRYKIQLWGHDADGRLTHAEVNTDDRSAAIDAARIYGLIAAGHPDEEPAEPHVCPPAPTPGQHGQELAALRAVRDAAEAIEAVYADTTIEPERLGIVLRPQLANLSIALRPFREGG